MAAADVLDSFCHLPEASRRELEQWIGKARENEAHWCRINTLVMAIGTRRVCRQRRRHLSRGLARSEHKGKETEGSRLARLDRRGALHTARADSTLFETLRITHELVGTLRDEGVLGMFLLLPKDEQANFVRWIGATDDEVLRHDRTVSFVLALMQAPLSR